MQRIKTYIDEIALFVYSGNIVAIGKIAKYELDENNRVAGFQLREDSFRVFDNTYDLVKLERKMTSNGYNVSINRGPGWNEIPQEYERVVINYLVENEWKSYL
ncbi:hypothetical protein H1D32_09050 [Anaerobacillus sp. CMMVII]|uniref:hypothetical protein n=1 Tax=Anaerobacillus sp. CMMVII TaxID=2755588 RepID=UPI0021B81D1A|nr:hypothetical protein [Anaerobacillus sp. CMMVII]MCT8137888.1 hypothetical protein [Anaerobacillus sp. CMMVII]